MLAIKVDAAASEVINLNFPAAIARRHRAIIDLVLLSALEKHKGDWTTYVLVFSI